MNAKETLKKIAEALNIVGESEIEKVEDSVEKVEAPVETVEAPVEAELETVEEVKEAVSGVVNTTENSIKEAQDKRVIELEGQLNDLKQLLKDSMAQPEVPEIPEVQKKSPKGLTHSPEKEVKKTASGIGKKGETIQSRVFKYINNN